MEIQARPVITGARADAIVFGFVVVLVGIVMIWRAAMELGVAPELRATPSGAAFPASVFPWPNLLLVGVGVGFLSGLLGVGGGTLMVPVLVFLLGQRQHAA